MDPSSFGGTIWFEYCASRSNLEIKGLGIKLYTKGTASIIKEPIDSFFLFHPSRVLLFNPIMSREWKEC